VLGIFLTLLWTTGFFKSEELAVLARLRRSTRRARTPARPPETTELAGEIVATELAAEELGGGPPQPGTAGGARND
jgi:hypothetical protein